MPKPARRDPAFPVLCVVLASIVAIAFVSAIPSYDWPNITGEDSLANWVIAAFTVVAALTSILAVFLVRASLAQTREAVTAAIESNRISQEIFATDQRPWIMLGRPKIGYDDDSDTYFIEISAENIGKTPANDVTINSIAKRVQFPNSSAKALAAFVQRFSEHVVWPAGGKLIFPGRDRPLADGGYIEEGNHGKRFVRVLYCVTYVSRGSKEIRHTAGQAIFKMTNIDDAMLDGYKPVTSYSYFGVDIAD